MQPVAYFTKFYWNTTALLYLPASVAASLQPQSLKRLLRAPKRKMSAAPWDSERWPPGLRYVVSNDTLGVVSRMKVDVWAKELKRSSRHILGAFHSECCAVGFESMVSTAKLRMRPRILILLMEMNHERVPQLAGPSLFYTQSTLAKLAKSQESAINTEEPHVRLPSHPSSLFFFSLPQYHENWPNL